MKIDFKKIKLSKDKNSVEITGTPDTKIKMSILQLARIWGLDKKITEEALFHFGSEKLEMQCNETRELIKKFPKIKLEGREMKISSVDILTKDDKILKIIGEDLCGWNNEGIKIEMSKKIYDKNLDGKEFSMRLNPKEIELRIK
jgi:uncharacterized secreted protein with C-terminal beta-propeller domain